MKTIFIKELRDCLRWTPLGMVLGLVMLWMVWPTDVSSATQMESSLITQLGLCASLIAIALGLLQSLFDIRNDSRGYLLHRPIERQKIFWGKVAAGYVAYMITLAVPVVAAMVYLQIRGIERMPTNALQVVPFLIVSVVIFLLHPTAIWIANRDARWVGTRLLPFIGAVALIVFFNALFSELTVSWFLASIAGLLAVFAIFASFTLLASRHAFVHQAQLPPRSSVSWRSIAAMVGLVFSGIVLYGAVVVFLDNSIPKTPQDYITYGISMNDQGEWQQIASRRPGGNFQEEETLARDINGEGEFKKVSKDWNQVQSAHLMNIQSWNHDRVNQQFRLLGSAVSKRFAPSSSGYVSLVGHRERVLAYDQENRLVSIITPDGNFKNMHDATGAFDGRAGLPPLQQLDFVRGSANPFLFDKTGVYQLDGEKLVANKLIDGKVSNAVFLLPTKDHPASLWTVVDGTLTRYDLTPLIPGQEMQQFSFLPNNFRLQNVIPVVQVVKSQAYPVEPLSDVETLDVLQTIDGGFATVRNNLETDQATYAMLTSSGGVEEIGEVKLSTMQTGHSEDFLAWMLPPALMCCFFAGGFETSMMIFVFVHALIAAVAAWWLGGRLDLSPRERMIWTIIAAVLGFGAVIGLRSIYRKLVKERCSECNKATRVDLESCQHCGHAWDPPPQEGVEIFEREPSSELVAAH